MIYSQQSVASVKRIPSALAVRELGKPACNQVKNLRVPRIAKQQGYLMLLAIIAVVIAGVVSSVLVNVYTVGSHSALNSLQAEQARYIAVGALEIATHDLFDSRTVECQDINWENRCYPPSQSSDCQGYYSVVGTFQEASARLRNAISATDTTIRLDDLDGSFLSSGIIAIDDEIIWYSRVNGQRLQGLIRGIAGTVAEEHRSNARVKQILCTLTATAYVPNRDNPEGVQRISSWIWENNAGGSRRW